MKIKIEFIGFPIIYDLFPEGQHSYSFPGGTLPGLIEDLAAHEDPRVKESLLDPGTGSLDPTIQIMVNQKLVPKTRIQEQEIGEGDHITFLKLLAGG
jgi:sulfur carrier protein ThiS